MAVVWGKWQQTSEKRVNLCPNTQDNPQEILAHKLVFLVCCCRELFAECVLFFILRRNIEKKKHSRSSIASRPIDLLSRIDFLIYLYVIQEEKLSSMIVNSMLTYVSTILLGYIEHPNGMKVNRNINVGFALQNLLNYISGWYIYKQVFLPLARQDLASLEGLQVGHCIL